MRIQRITAMLALAAASALTLTGCTMTNNAPDQQAVLYADGAFHDKTFKSCAPPSAIDYSSWFTKASQYPAGDRTYAFTDARNGDGSAGGDIGAFKTPSKNNAELTVSGIVRFQLTRDCGALQQFHEKIGLTNDWTTVLQKYLAQPLNRAITDATQQYNWEELYGNTDGAQAKWEGRVKELLPKYIAETAGGAYFDIGAVTMQKPSVTPDLQKTIDAVQQAIQENKAQEQRNATVTSELQSIRELVAVLGPDAYNVYQAIKDGRIPVIQSGTVVQLPAAPR